MAANYDGLNFLRLLLIPVSGVLLFLGVCLLGWGKPFGEYVISGKDVPFFFQPFQNFLKKRGAGVLRWFGALSLVLVLVFMWIVFRFKPST